MIIFLNLQVIISQIHATVEVTLSGHRLFGATAPLTIYETYKQFCRARLPTVVFGGLVEDSLA